MTVKKEEPKPKKKRKQTEVERLKEFGSWEPWEKRGYDPYQTFQDDEDDEDQYASITSQGKGKKGKGKSKKKRPVKKKTGGDPGINRLDRLAKQHDIDYSRATSHKDKLIADRKMVAGIDRFPGKKTMTEKIVKKIMQGKIKLGL